MTMSTLRATVIDRESQPSVERRATRQLGAVVAAAIAAPIGTAVFVFAHTPFFLAGLPAATIAGAVLGPQIRSRSSIASAVVAMAILTIVLADIVVCAWAVAEPGVGLLASTDVMRVIVGSFYIGLIGLVIVGVPMLIVAVPCAVVWAWTVRRFAR